MKVLISAVVVALAAVSVACAGDKDSRKIQDLVNSYESALNASDVDKALELYSEVPTFMPQHAPAQIGRDAVKQAYQAVFASIDLNIEFTIHELEVLGDTAWARTSSAGKTTILANKAVIEEGNNELFIFKKEQGHWKIYQYLFATNQPRQ